MTGFRQKDARGAGAVQMLLTAGLLEKMGYKWWDLGSYTFAFDIDFCFVQTFFI